MEIVNKVAQSGLVEFNLEDLYIKGDRVVFDIKEQLFQGLILREKDKMVALVCTADAIVPTWAYMLLATALEPYAKRIVFGNLEVLETVLFNESLSKIEIEKFRDQRIVIKGCSNLPVPESAYVEITRLLRPVAKSIMYGEPCSTVPIYKQKSTN